MALDQFGQYVCEITPPPPDPAGSGCCSLSGHGAPDNSLGEDGIVYVDLDTGDFYVKTDGTWNLQTGGGGGGSSQIVAYTTTGPTADGVTPTDLNSPAIAVKPGATTFTWDVVNAVWDDV